VTEQLRQAGGDSEGSEAGRAIKLLNQLQGISITSARVRFGMFKGRLSANVDNEAYVLARALPSHLRADRHAEERIALSVLGVGSRRNTIGSPFHVDDTRCGS
jgi:hypothetical protein